MANVYGSRVFHCPSDKNLDEFISLLIQAGINYHMPDNSKALKYSRTHVEVFESGRYGSIETAAMRHRVCIVVTDQFLSEATLLLRVHPQVLKTWLQEQ